MITGKEYDDYPTSWSDSVDAIAQSDVPAGLVRLEFNRGGYWDISSTELGDLSPAYPKLARLRELKIELGAAGSSGRWSCQSFGSSRSSPAD